MLGQRKGEGLRLQSYKVDSQVLASKINELNDLRSELVTTLTKQRSQENSITDELEHLRAENDKLRALLSDLEFTKKSQAHLIQQLEKRLESAQERVEEASRRAEKEQQEMAALREYYERRAGGAEQREYMGKAMEVSKVTEFRQPPPPFKVESQSISSIEGSSKCESNRKIKKLKKPSLQSDSPLRPSLQLSEKYMTANAIAERQDDSRLSGEDVFLEMIRQLYRQLLKIEIRGRQLLKIPQVQAFSRLRNPSKNDLAKLCSSYPFHIRQTHKMELIYEFVAMEAERVGKLLSGRFVTDLIIEQIEEIDGSQDLEEEGEGAGGMPGRGKVHGRGREKEVSMESWVQGESEGSSYF